MFDINGLVDVWIEWWLNDLRSIRHSASLQLKVHLNLDLIQLTSVRQCNCSLLVLVIRCRSYRLASSLRSHFRATSKHHLTLSHENSAAIGIGALHIRTHTTSYTHISYSVWRMPLLNSVAYLCVVAIVLWTVFSSFTFVHILHSHCPTFSLWKILISLRSRNIFKWLIAGFRDKTKMPTIRGTEEKEIIKMNRTRVCLREANQPIGWVDVPPTPSRTMTYTERRGNFVEQYLHFAFDLFSLVVCRMYRSAVCVCANGRAIDRIEIDFIRTLLSLHGNSILHSPPSNIQMHSAITTKCSS